MLLEFSATNYKSFKDKFVFSLVPEPEQTGLGYSVMETEAGGEKYKALCSSVIYGPNASGKTNIISAMDTFKQIVLRGNIRNQNTSEEDMRVNVASAQLDLIPNNTNKKSLPTEFSIKFIENDYHIEYMFSADFGVFLDYEHTRKIISESLKVNQKTIFSRLESILEIEADTIMEFKELLLNEFERNAGGAIALAKNNLSDEELFLVNGFKSMFSSKLANLITDWLIKRYMPLCSSNTLNFVPSKISTTNGQITTYENMHDIATRFGINSNTLAYMSYTSGSEPALSSVFELENRSAVIPAELFESYGTIRFMNMFPLIAMTLQNGATLIVDEFDASIHPMALMSIIGIFHNDEINKNKAQLIFNTHNPIFLNKNLFREDEIKFVDRDDDTHISELYSLSDFDNRETSSYMENYFIDHYGAIKDIDFAPIFEKLMANEKPVKD